MTDASPNDRLATLRAAQLVALARGHDGTELSPQPFPHGAAAMAGSAAWVLLGDGQGLGAGLAWAIRRSASSLNVLAPPTAGGLLARRAALLSMPIVVYTTAARSIIAAAPEAAPASRGATTSHLAFLPTIEAAGAQPNVEHGVLSGEVLGLEVCRVVDGADSLEPRLVVGIGANDREAFRLLHGAHPDVAALAEVVHRVAHARRAGADPHPFNRLARERALRARLIAEPGLVEAKTIEPLPPPVPRTSAVDEVPCVARADDGRLLVISAGIDLDAVPFALDARQYYHDSHVTVVIPGADVVPIQRDLASLAGSSVSLVELTSTPCP